MVVRNTVQRQIVLDTVRYLKNHPTADEIYTEIHSGHPKISRGTVYRNLNFLADTGELLKVAMPDSADRFDHNTYKHYHVKCTCCGTVLDVKTDSFDGINTEIEQKTGFILDSHEIIFRGVCPDCKE